ncbi:hypothetical protein EMIHUDRAFT_220887 [Emiliania huxleyi CCMP1516]|uniref:HMG box domain-containing protein n=2 Tax=Emiliania huxleyi TaxID=2903 RepID=A0A0D3I0F4_EMIH1|nr:hypothetical protein EMIHUDRAFT_220887 [Emiliania huxleyi CCMP1516]EOD04739.1 hypothetical protein EMIHUDRAFT_220887 [Emiliania huxleyi CCMP1516]|eukprot:XP_005757168.1 hypothetical protein EMIHUDRAFT_220887 [Emiliania huxleyi CCMP1516]
MMTVALRCTWSTWSAVINLTSRAGELSLSSAIAAARAELTRAAKPLPQRAIPAYAAYVKEMMSKRPLGVSTPEYFKTLGSQWSGMGDAEKAKYAAARPKAPPAGKGAGAIKLTAASTDSLAKALSKAVIGGLLADVKAAADAPSGAARSLLLEGGRLKVDSVDAKGRIALTLLPSKAKE